MNLLPAVAMLLQDSEVRRTFMRTLEKQGLKFKMGTKVSKGEVVGSKVHLTLEPAKGGAAEKMEADTVLVSIGQLEDDYIPFLAAQRCIAK